MYAPIATKAPWPSEICPLAASTSRPRIAMKYAPTVASCTVRNSESTNGSTASTTTPAQNVQSLAVMRAPPRSRRRARCGRTSRTPKITASAVASRSSLSIQWMYVPARFRTTPSTSPPTTAPSGESMPPSSGGGERVEQHPEHHVRLEEERRRREHARDGAERGGEPPSHRGHRADVDPDQARLDRIRGGGAQPEPGLRAREEQTDEREGDDRDADHTELQLRERDAADVNRRRRERPGKLPGARRPRSTSSAR